MMSATEYQVAYDAEANRAYAGGAMELKEPVKVK